MLDQLRAERRKPNIHVVERDGSRGFAAAHEPKDPAMTPTSFLLAALDR